MNNKREIALNKLFNVCIISGLLLARVCVEFILGKFVGLAIGTGIATLLLIILPTLFTPYCYSFDSEGVSLCYVFLPTERYLWKDIQAIEVEYNGTSIKGRLDVVFDIFYASVFSIIGNNVGESRFYMQGYIRKSFRTKHLLEKYWDGEITGYLFEGAKKWFIKQRELRQTHIREHFTDEIVPMERDIRASARHWLNPFVAQAKQYGLDVKSKYIYITEDLKKSRSRPKEAYTYTLVAEIAHPDETDKSRVVDVSVDLLYVRLGRTAYRGVPNPHAEEEFRFYMTEVLDEIGKNGLAAYCKTN